MVVVVMMIVTVVGGCDDNGSLYRTNLVGWWVIFKYSVDCFYHNLLYLIVNLPDLRITRWLMIGVQMIPIGSRYATGGYGGAL